MAQIPRQARALLPRCQIPRPVALAWMLFPRTLLLPTHCRGHWLERNTAGPRHPRRPGPVRLENARLEGHDGDMGEWGGEWGALMFRRVVLILGLIAMGLALNGCTKCGPIWDDWVQSPKSCKSDRL